MGLYTSQARLDCQAVNFSFGSRGKTLSGSKIQVINFGNMTEKNVQVQCTFQSGI